MGQQGRLRIGVDLDLNKSKFNEVQAALQALQHITAKDLINSKNANEDLNSIISTAKKLEDALNKSFNPKLNSINLSQFKRELGALNLKQVEQQFAKVGAQGKNAFRNVAVELMTTNKHIRESSVLLDKMATTLANTVRWQVATQALNSMTGSVQKAYYFAKDLDTSLNDIRIVTEKGADEMAQFARHANKAAKELRALTTDYTKASLIYYQQGLGDQEVQERAETTVKVANITKQSADTVSGQLTAIWNGYKASAAETEIYIDKVSAVAARTAADLEELATGMSQVASAANIMGVDIDQLNAQLATIVSVTREAPESIGTALKTVYARMSDIEAGLDTETTLGEYTKKMKELGFDALDANNKLRDQGEVIEEIGNKWKSLSREQQTALAQTIAGTRQYSRMMALFDNWGMYEDALNASKDSMGALQKQQDIYTESIEAHLKSLSAEGEELYSTLFKPEDITPAIDAITTMVDAIENLIESIGGGKGLIKVLGSVGLNVFGNKITEGIGRTVRNTKGFLENIEQDKAYAEIEKQIEGTAFAQTEAAKEIFELKRKQFALSGNISKEEKEAVDATIRGRIEAERKKEELEEQEKLLKKIVNLSDGETFDDIFKVVNQQKYKKQLDQKAADIESEVIPKNTAIDIGYIDELELSRKNLARTRGAKTRAEKQYNRDENLSLSGFDINPEVLVKEYQVFTAALEDAKQAEQEYSETLKRIAPNFEELNGAIHKLGDDYIILAEDQEDYNEICKQSDKLLDKLSSGTELTKSELNELRTVVAKFTDISNRSAATIRKASADLSTHKDEVRQNNIELEKYKNKIKELKDGIDLTKTIEQFVTLAGQVANINTGFGLLWHLGDIWNNETLTTSEKFAQTLTNIAAAASMISAPILQARESYKKFHFEQSRGLILDTSQVISDNKVTDEFVEQIKAIIANTEATEKLNKATKEQILLKIAYGEALNDTEQGLINEAIEKNNLKIKDRNKEQGGWFKNTYVKPFTDFGKSAGEGLTKLGGTKFGALGGKAVGALGGSVGAMGSALITLTGVAAVAAAAGYAIYRTIKAYNKQADALKAANEEQQKMNENLTNAQQRYDNVRQSIEGYNKQLETLKELTEGTTEWKDAILATNDAALKLLNTYPELAKYVESGPGGAIQLSEAGLIEYQNRERAKVSAAQIAATNATQRQRQAQIEYDTAMLVRGTTSDNFVSNSKVAQVIEKLSDVSYPQLIDSNDSLIKALNENPEALQKLTATIEQNNKLLAIENAANYAEQLRAQGYSSEDAAVLGGIASANATNKDAEVEKRAAEIATRIKAINNEDLIKEWAEATGRTIEEGTLSKTGAGWGGRSGKFSIGDQTFTFEQLVKDLAAVEYDKEQTDAQSIKKYQDDLNKIQSKGVKDIVSSVAKASGAITANALEDFTGADIDKLKEELNKQLPKSLESFRDELKETVQNLEEASTNPTKAYGVNQSVVDAAVAGAGENQWQTLFDKLGSKAAGNILDVGQNVFNVGGSTGLSAFQGFIEELGENAQTVFTEVDFASEEWEKQLLQTAEGIDLDATALNRFQYYVKQFAPSAKTAEDRLKNLNEVLASIKEQGQILDAEKFDTLKEELPMEELDNYFTQMADGTYMLTSAASLFVAEAREARRAQLLQGIDTEIGERDKWETDKQKSINEIPQASIKSYDEKAYAEKIAEVTQIATDMHISDLLGSWLKRTTQGKTFAETVQKSGIATYEDDILENWYPYIDTDRSKIYDGQKIVVDTKLGAFGGNQTLDKTTMVNDIAATVNKENYAVYSYNNKSLLNWIDQLYKLGLLKEDEYNTFKAEIGNPARLIQNQGQDLVTEIQNSVQDNITSSKFDDSQLKTLVQQYLEDAQSSAEYKAIIDTFSNGPYQIDFEDTIADEGEKSWAEIAQGGKRLARIQEQSNATAKYKQALAIQEEALADIERRMSDLADLSSVVYGSDAIENLSAQNELLDERLQLLRDAEILENNRRQALFTDFKTDKADVSELQGALETILDSTDALDIVTIDDALKSLDVTSLESAADYQAFISALSSRVDSDELELQAFDIVRSILDPLFSDETEEKIRATILDQLSNNLEAFELELDLALNVTEAERSYNKFLHAIAKDEQEIFSTYISDAGTLAKDMATYQKGLQDLATYEVVDDERFKELQEKAKEEGYKLAENLISATDFQAKRQALVNDLISTTIDLQQTQLNVIELQSSAQKKQIDYLNTVNSMLESQVELTQLIYGDDTDKVGDFYSKIVDNNKAMRDSAEATYDYWNAIYTDIRKTPDQFSQEYKDKVLAELTSSTEQYMSAVTNVAKAQQQEYLNFLKQSLKEFKVESYGKEWDWIKFDEDQYLDSIDTLYAIEDLEATFRKAANESTDVKTQQKINSLLEDELASLEKRDKLTQYDFDRAKKKLDILQAEIALEEARNSTTSMRLMRGADGTYGFQYVADMDAVSEAQENLREANQSLYELDTDRYRENLDQFYSIYQEYVTKMQEFWADGDLTAEESEELSKLAEQMQGLADISMIAQENLRMSAAESVTTLGGTTEDIIKALDEKFNTGLAGIVGKVSENGIQVVFAELEQKIKDTANNYLTAVQEEEHTLNTLLGDGDNGTIGLYKTLADEQSKVIANITTEAEKINNDLVPSMQALNQQYAATVEYLKEINGYWNNSENITADAGNRPAPKFEGMKENSMAWFLDSSLTITGSQKYKNSGARSEAKEYFNRAFEWIEANAKMENIDAWLGKDGSYANLKQGLLSDREWVDIDNFQLIDKLIRAIQNQEISAFNTGGYTGEWGTDGRLAMLHEKELVLNQTDTHNMLLAVSTLRNLASALDLQAMHTQAKALSGLESSIAAWELANEMAIEQNVYVTAEFPNATQESEIREAILGLANAATQHAYKNTRV